MKRISLKKPKIIPPNDSSTSILTRIIRRALKQDRRSPVDQRPVDDVRMSGDPADVGDASEYVVGVVVGEDVTVREGRVEEVAGRAVSDALRCAGAAGRVQDEEVVLGVHGLRLAFWRYIRKSNFRKMRNKLCKNTNFTSSNSW